MGNESIRMRTLTGRVVSNKMQKTITVLVERRVKHPKYGKIMKKCSKIKAHDAEQVCKIGDLVKIKQVRPLSKHKSWMLMNVLPAPQKTNHERTAS